MTLTTLSLIGLTASLLAIKIAFIAAAVVWTVRGYFRTPKLRLRRSGNPTLVKRVI
jgi:hypothetical protein